MADTNGFDKYQLLILTKLDEHGKAINLLVEDLSEVKERLAGRDANEQSCATVTSNRISRVEKAVADVGTRVSKVETAVDRAVTGTSAVKTAVIVTTSVLGTVAAAWAWINQHFAVTRIK